MGRISIFSGAQYIKGLYRREGFMAAARHVVWAYASTLRKARFAPVRFFKEMPVLWRGDRLLFWQNVALNVDAFVAVCIVAGLIALFAIFVL